MKTLFVVGTPIGNLSDITYRAVETLKNVPVIACETPLQTRKLLSHLNIRNKTLIRYREANKSKIIPLLLDILEKRDVALVSDAGTPLIADPGTELIDEVWSSGGNVVVIPGPSAIIAALSVAGLRADHFIFSGFLPRIESKLRRMLDRLAKEDMPVVAFETPHRLLKTLRLLSTHYPNAFVVLAKELTKIHEHILRGSPSEALQASNQDQKFLKGEFVLIVKLPKSLTK